MKKLDLIYEGKAKRLFQTDDPHLLVMEYKDQLTAFNAKKRLELADKGRINKEISDLLFLHLGSQGISHHLVGHISPTESIVKRVQVLPLEFVIRNRAEGSIVQRLGLQVGQAFSEPILEIYYKNDSLGDPLVNEDHARVLFGVSAEEMIQARAICIKTNEVLQQLFNRVGLLLFDFKIELGVWKDQVILVDEISPDSMRLRDTNTAEIFDKDRFRRDLGGVAEAYQEVLSRLKEVSHG